VIQGLLKGDVVFTNLESAIAEKGETAQEGRGFLTPPEALDALMTFGFNLLSLSRQSCIRSDREGYSKTRSGKRIAARSFTPGTGNNVAEAVAPGYLHTPNGTIALIASASGLITPGGNAAADRAGRERARVEAGDKENEATDDLPGAPGNTPNQGDSQPSCKVFVTRGSTLTS